MPADDGLQLPLDSVRVRHASQHDRVAGSFTACKDQGTEAEPAVQELGPDGHRPDPLDRDVLTAPLGDAVQDAEAQGRNLGAIVKRCRDREEDGHRREVEQGDRPLSGVQGHEHPDGCNAHEQIQDHMFQPRGVALPNDSF